jgi:hypothetical protein
MFNRKIFLVVISIWILIIFQYISYGGRLTPAAFYRPLWIFYTPYLVYTLMGVKYFKYLFNVIFWIAAYTSVIYLLQSFFPAFNNFLLKAFNAVFRYSWADWPRSILIYSIPRESGYFFMRNSGIFSEPGTYAIYLMLGIIINTFFTKQAFQRKNIFLAIVLLSTFSTTGYIMLFTFLCYAVIKLKIHFALKPTVIILLFIIGTIAYRNAIFLEQKIEGQLTTEVESVKKGEKNQRGRFYSFGMSMKSFLKTPVIGQGILTIHKYNVGETGSFGYGFIGLFARYGMLFGLFYMWNFYKGFSNISYIFQCSKFYQIIAFITVNIGLLSQILFFHTPFVYFFMIGLFLPNHSLVKHSPIIVMAAHD